MTEQELNKKLAEWAGFELLDTQFYEHSSGCAEVETWQYPNGVDTQVGCPNFTSSLDACFKWLVPKLVPNLYSGMESLELYYYFGAWRVRFSFNGEKYHWAEAETPALALCLAIEKLIDNQ